LSLSMYSSSSQGVLQAMAMKPGKGAITMPHQAYNRIALAPADLYLIDNVDLDAKFVYTDLQLGLRLLSMLPDEVSKLEIKTDSNNNEKQIVDQIYIIYNNHAKVSNKIQNYESIYNMFLTENIAVY